MQRTLDAVVMCSQAKPSQGLFGRKSAPVRPSTQPYANYPTNPLELCAPRVERAVLLHAS